MVSFTDLPTDIGRIIAATLATEARAVLHGNDQLVGTLRCNEAFEALSKLSRTCRGYHQICLPHLYRSFGVTATKNGLQLFLRTAIQRTDLAAMVREVHFANVCRMAGINDLKRSPDRLPFPITPKSFLQSLQQGDYGLGIYLFAFLAFLPQLESLTFLWCGYHLELPPFSMDYIAHMGGAKQLRHFHVCPIDWTPETERVSFVPDLDTLKASVRAPWFYVKYGARFIDP